MSKRKGISAEEKREKLLNLFHETKDVYTVKELEKCCQKKLGISPMVIKDVLQQIMDDNLVETDKVGINTVYWSFPSQASQQKRLKIEKLEAEVAAISSSIAGEQEKLAATLVGKDETDERREILGSVSALESAQRELKAGLAKQAKNDPTVFKALKEEVNQVQEAANRWTDNVWELRKYCVDKMGIEGKQFDQMCKGMVDDAFEDYIEV